METTFYNITITITEGDPKKAYERLCNLLSQDEGLEYQTDTYDTTGWNHTHSTQELFPIQDTDEDEDEDEDIVRYDPLEDMPRWHKGDT